MPMTASALPSPAPQLDDDRLRRAVAGFAFHAQLAGRRLPEHLAGVPDDAIIDRLTRMDAKELLETLKELYDVAWWDKESFERAFVEGALEGWRPGSLVQRSPHGLRIVSTTCPVAADVEKDRRVCDACQSLQRHAAKLALIGQVESVEAERVMADGESACAVDIRWR